MESFGNMVEHTAKGRVENDRRLADDAEKYQPEALPGVCEWK